MLAIQHLQFNKGYLFHSLRPSVLNKLFDTGLPQKIKMSFDSSGDSVVFAAFGW